MVNRPLKVLQTDNYLMNFNSPRQSQHSLRRTKFFPLRKIWQPLDGWGVWIPQVKSYDLIHSFNRVPITRKPWIVTFEAELPRTIGDRKGIVKNILRTRLLLENCLRLIAMSDYAKFKFMNYNRNWQFLDQAVKKTEIIYPSIITQVEQAKVYSPKQVLRILFVGNDFARKGGIVALRLAQKAMQQKLPIQVEIVSGMNYGEAVYTDERNRSRYDPDIQLLQLDNVVFHGKQPNSQVIELMQQCHLQIMTTLHDTYGFSLLEGFSVAMPAIATNVCALPEIINSGENGYLIDLKLRDREWIDLGERNQPDYWEIVNPTYESLAEQALQFVVENILDNPENYESLSQGALKRAKTVHNPLIISEQLDQLYGQCWQA